MVARKTVRKFAADLKVGDEVVGPGGIVLTVAYVDACAAFTIVDFTDGTATPPLAPGVWMDVQHVPKGD